MVSATTAKIAAKATTRICAASHQARAVPIVQPFGAEREVYPRVRETQSDHGDAVKSGWLELLRGRVDDHATGEPGGEFEDRRGAASHGSSGDARDPPMEPPDATLEAEE
jgi:hypothetical protein